MIAYGVDLGATHIRAAAVEIRGAHARIIRHARGKVGVRKDPERVVRVISRVLEKVGALRGRAPIAVAAAAQLSPDGKVVRNSPNLGWRDAPLHSLLRQRLGRTALVENDINAAAVGEARFGAGQGSGHVFVALLGSGLGNGLVLDGRLYRGASWVAGEFGHVKVRGPRGRRCGCGQRGCLEAYVGGVKFAERVREELARGTQSSLQGLFRKDPETISVAAVERAAFDQKDAYALRRWREVADLLGTALANAVSMLNPERVVLGGGVLLHCPRLYERAALLCRERSLAVAGDAVTVVPAALGDDAGVIGAAALAAESRYP